jgi:hypothetical protein
MDSDDLEELIARGALTSTPVGGDKAGDTDMAGPPSSSGSMEGEEGASSEEM